MFKWCKVSSGVLHVPYETADNFCLADIAQMYKFVVSASV